MTFKMRPEISFSTSFYSSIGFYSFKSFGVRFKLTPTKQLLKHFTNLQRNIPQYLKRGYLGHVRFRQLVSKYWQWRSYVATIVTAISVEYNVCLPFCIAILL